MRYSQRGLHCHDKMTLTQAVKFSHNEDGGRVSHQENIKHVCAGISANM